MSLWRESMYHERVFGGYVLFTLVRIWLAAGFASYHFIMYAASLMFIVAGVALPGLSGSARALRARLAIYPALMLALFADMRSLSPLINTGKMDSALWNIDRMLAGGSLSVKIQPFISPVMTELMSFCYMFFMIYVFIALALYLFSPSPAAKIFYSGFFSVYGIGYFGYTLIPAMGPYVAQAGMFSVPLDGFFLTNFLASVYPFGTNYTDAFPSLHVAASAYMLFFDAKWNRRRFAVCAAPCAGIWLSVIYLRYHYFADALAGFALAALGLYIARLAQKRMNHCDI